MRSEENESGRVFVLSSEVRQTENLCLAISFLLNFASSARLLFLVPNWDKNFAQTNSPFSKILKKKTRVKEKKNVAIT